MPEAQEAPVDGDFFQEVTLNLPDVNKDLVLIAFEGVSRYSPEYEALFHAYQAAPSGALFNVLQNALLDSFPSIVSIQIRDLFTPEGKTRGRLRLQELNEAYLTLARLLNAAALAGLWDAVLDVRTLERRPDFIIREEYRKDLQMLLQSTSANRDYFWSTATAQYILQDNGMAPYVAELTDLQKDLRQAGLVYDAYRFLEQLRQRLAAGDIPSGEVEDLCAQSERHLGRLLCSCAFLCRYQLVTIKDIIVHRPRREARTAYIHRKAVLRGRDYATIDQEPMRRGNFINNSSVFLALNIQDEELPLNLSPFLIDENTFRIGGEQLPKIHFFDGGEGGAIHYRQAEMLQNGFTVKKDYDSRRYRDLDMLLTQFSLFMQDLGI